MAPDDAKVKTLIRTLRTYLALLLLLVVALGFVPACPESACAAPCAVEQAAEQPSMHPKPQLPAVAVDVAPAIVPLHVISGPVGIVGVLADDSLPDQLFSRLLI